MKGRDNLEISVTCDCGYKGDPVFEQFGYAGGSEWESIIICVCPSCSDNISIEKYMLRSK